MNEPNSNSTVPEFKDRSAGLIAFGILDILLGAGCVLMMALVILGQTMSARTTGMGPNAGMILPVAMVYGGLAVAFVWLGIGSIKCRRWARALLLILSWSWLLVGIIAEGAMVLMLPRILSTAPATGQEMPPGALTAIMLISFLFVGVLFIVIPGVMTFFYGSRHVKATCEARDPLRGWTDYCPLPVLAGSCWLWFGGVSMLFMPVCYHSVMPFCGILISGLPGAILFVSLAALWLWLGRMCYRLWPAAWWILVVVLVLFTVSNALTFTRIDLIEMYRKMGYPEAQIEMIRKQGLVTNRFFLWWTLGAMLPILGYLVWVKRFFRHSHCGVERDAHTAAQ